jgi:hypothetical protein
MNQKIEELLEYLPSKEYDKALKYYENNEIELLKEHVENTIFNIQSSLDNYGKHSKYYMTVDMNNLDCLLKTIEDDYYDYLNHLDYLHECEMKSFDKSYLEYE